MTLVMKFESTKKFWMSSSDYIGAMPGDVPSYCPCFLSSLPTVPQTIRCLFMIHSDEDLDAIALGLLRLLNDARLEKHRFVEAFL